MLVYFRKGHRSMPVQCTAVGGGWKKAKNRLLDEVLQGGEGLTIPVLMPKELRPSSEVRYRLPKGRTRKE